MMYPSLRPWESLSRSRRYAICVLAVGYYEDSDTSNRCHCSPAEVVCRSSNFAGAYHTMRARPDVTQCKLQPVCMPHACML